MVSRKHWQEYQEGPGIYRIEFSSYRWFFDFIQTELLDYKTYVYRGQRDPTWPLESTLDRKFRLKKIARTKNNTSIHLNRFKLACRGRIGSSFAKEEDESEWWAIGQHYGLATPLLDWSESPFVALFFAFDDSIQSSTTSRIVYAVAQGAISIFKKENRKKGSDNYVDIIRPKSGDNSRLVNQGGLFLSMPPNSDLESYIKSNVDKKTDEMDLIKFIIPDVKREIVMRYLNRMNINHLTLFPDLIGASIHSNMALMIDKY